MYSDRNAVHCEQRWGLTLHQAGQMSPSEGRFVCVEFEGWVDSYKTGVKAGTASDIEDIASAKEKKARIASLNQELSWIFGGRQCARSEHK